MPITSDNLRAVLRETTFIKQEGITYLAYATPFRQIDHSAFTVAELRILDSRLPLVLQELKMYELSLRTGQLQATALYASLLYWEQPPCMTLPYQSPNGPVLEAALRELHIATVNDQMVHMTGMAYRLKSTIGGMVYATVHQMQSFAFKAADVERLYPGWEDRYHLAETLEVTPLEKARFVAGIIEPKVQVDLSGLEFDA